MSISDDGIPTGTLLPGRDALITDAGELIDPLDPNGQADGERVIIRSRFVLPQEPIEPVVFPGLALNPVIDDLQPRSGAPGTPVAIIGRNFTPFEGTVRFNGVVSSYNATTTTRIDTVVPNGATTGRVSVDGFNSPFDFVVLAPGTAPTITGFSPAGGRPGDVVSISGTNLDRVTEARFNGVRADGIAPFSPQILQATVPAGATTGPITVSGPSGSATSAASFVVGTGTPAITSFSPTAGTTGTPVDIFGTELGGATRVTFNAADAQFSVISNTQVRAFVPGFVGVGPIRVHTPLGIAVSAQNFTAGATLPTITSFSPTSGRPGDIVAINGTRLDQATGVRIGSVRIGVISRPSDQQITFTVPQGATTGNIILESAAGEVVGGVFTVLPPAAAVTVTGINPTSGFEGSGVFISGTGLDQVTAVTFTPGVPAQFGRTGDGRLATTVPAGAMTGPITLTFPGGTVQTPVFTVITSTAPGVIVLSPSTGQTFNAGQVINVIWTASDDGTIVSQDILYSSNGGATFTTLVPGLPGATRDLLVQLPGQATEAGVIAVRATDNTGRTGEGRSAIFRVLGPPVDRPPAVTVIAPNGGETLRVGQAFTISWNSSDDMGLAAHDVAVSYDGGASWESLAAGIPGFRRNLQFTPSRPGAAALVSVTAVDTAGQRTTDRSDAPFAILPPDGAPVVTVIAPNGGETFAVGQNVAVTWQAADDAGILSQEVRVSYDGGVSWEPVAQNLPPAQRRVVFPARLITDLAMVAVRVTDTAQQTTVDRSDAPFRIVSAPPTVRVTAPNGGETFRVGEPFTISWESTGDLARHDVRISYDGGAGFQDVATNIPGTRRNALCTPDRTSDNAVVQVIATDLSGRIGEDRGDAAFRIVRQDGAPQVRVNTPNGGETFVLGQPITIGWTSQDDTGVVRDEVKVSYDGGATWEGLAILPGGVGRTSFQPRLATDRALVSVTATDTAGQSTEDRSDTPFRIVPPDAPPMVRVITPNGGDTFIAGQPFTISWESSDDREIAFHDVRISYDGGVTFENVVTMIPGFRRNATCTPRTASDTARVAVAAVDSAGQRTEDLSDQFFRILPPPTDAPPTVRVMAPNGGEQLLPGQTVTVTWTSADDRGLMRHDVRYTTDGGRTFKPIAEGIPGFRREARWIVPNEPTGFGMVSVTATDTANQSTEDRSDGFFTIIGLLDLPPTVKVMSPNGGETLLAGKEVTVSWDSQDDRGLDSHDVEFSLDGGATWRPIVLNIPGFRRNVQWTVPDQASDRALVRVTARDTAGQKGSDTSDATFRIVRFGPSTTVTVLSPNGGEQLQPGQRITISWRLDGDTPISQDVRFSADGGASFTRVASALPGTDRSVGFTLPGVNTTMGVIEVVTRDAAGVVTARDRSDAFFSIGAPPQATVTVLAPNGGERFTPGQATTICWKIVGSFTPASQDVKVSFDGGATFLLVARVSGLFRNFTWTVPNQPTTQGLVSISFLDGMGRLVEDRGDGFFTIAAMAMPPRVDSVFPGFGPVTGGTPITVRGANFDARARVRVGGMDAVTFGGTGTELNALTPRARFAGFVRVEVINPDGSTGVLENGFRYVLSGAAEPATGQVVFQSALPAGLEADMDAVDGAMLDAGARLLIGEDPGDADVDISRPLGRSLLLPAGAEPVTGILPGEEIVARVAGPPEVIELFPGERIGITLFAELYDARGQAVRGRALDVVCGGKPASSTLVIQTRPVFSFTPFTALLATTLDTPAGEYLLRFAGQTLTAPFLLTPELRVPIRVLQAPKPFGPATAQLEIGPATVTDAMAALGPVEPSAERGIVSLAAGATVSVPVTPVLLDADGGRLDDLVRLAAASLPAGAVARIAPNPVATFQSATLSVTLDAATAAGRYAVDVSGASAGTPPGLAYDPAQLLLDVRPRIRTVRIAAATAEARVTAGQAAEFALTLSRTGYADGPVQLSAQGLPAGARAAFDPAAPTGDAATLRIFTTSATPAGTYPVSISGRTEVDGVEVTGTAVRLIVEAPPVARTVKLAVTPTSVALRPGGSAKLAVKINRTNATDVQVALRAAGNLPAGTVFAFTPARTITSSSTLVVTLPADARPGAYTFTVQGTTLVSGVTIEPSTPVAVKVDPLA